MFHYTALLASTLLIQGCAPVKETRGAGRYIENFEFKGKMREFILRVPKNYDSTKPAPLVVALHGLTSNMNAFETGTRIGEKADKEGFIVAIPNGLPEKFRGWNADFFKMAGDVDDVPFLEEVMNRVEKEFSIDKKREYVFGHSNGAMMAYYVGSRLSGRLAAVAGIAGTIGIPQGSTKLMIPEPKHPISVLLIHGQKDKVVGYAPSDNAMLRPIGALESTSWWAEKNGCVGKPTTEKINDVANWTKYAAGKDGVNVALISCVNGTHNIPGGVGDSDGGINSTDFIWDFFKANPKK
jgi:polyhydroxybutyrate depolymerase